MLGIWITPNGDNDKQVEALRDAAIHWGSKIKLGNPSLMEAWYALHTNISAKLKYPLSACKLSLSQCKSIMFPAIKAALPRIGIASNFAAAVRDGPLDSGGAGVLSLYHS